MNATIRNLFQYILAELRLDGYESVLWRLAVDSDNWSEVLPDIAAQFDLNCTEAELSLVEALPLSGLFTPVITQIDPQTWLVLRGFRRGRIAGAIITRNRMATRLFKRQELARLLSLNANQKTVWYMLEVKEPMAAASSLTHDHHLEPWQRLIGMLKPEKNDLMLVIVFALGTGLLYLATPVAVQALVNTVALGGMFQPLVILALILFIFLGFAGFIYVLQTYLVELIQRRLFVSVSVDLANRLPRIRREVYEKSNPVELLNRFFDVMTIQKSGSTLLLEGLATLLQAVIGLLVLAAYHPLLLVFDLVLMGLIVFILVVLGRRSVTTAIEESKAKYAVVAWLQSITRNIHSFKFYGGSELARLRTDELAHTYLANRQRHYRIVLRQTIAAVALHAIAGTSLLAMGGLLVVEGQLTLGQLVAAELIVSGVLSAFAKFGKQLEGFYDLMAAVDKVGHIIDLPLEEDGQEKPVRQQHCGLRVMNLNFSYHQRNTLVKNLSFELERGKNLAVFCPSGSGKTTLAELISGLRMPQSGRIELDGIDLRELRLAAFREQVAVISRLEFIEDTILENVRLGRTEISHQRVREVLSQLGLLDELLTLPEGLNTPLNVNGSPLSSCQLDRLQIARAIAGHPGLLVIDSVLDELDVERLDQVFDTLLHPDSTWSLLILTRLKPVAERCERYLQWSGR